MEQRFRNDVGRLWGNQEELQTGLSASEFNLRAHQKMLNALAVDMLNLRKLAEAEGAELEPMSVLLAEVEVPSVEEGAKPEKVVRPNWPAYHKMVEGELRLMAEAEAAVRKEAEENTAAEEEAKEEEPAEAQAPETEEADYPEGAAVFGG